ncbi:hypothetical protein IWW55_006978 [Coemansia sp. RSA 2706]|nr:hypothetical protein LPJ63_001672 [Coemansia sp. RSA 2711]KAJ2286430.1 hypothetical protein IWW55_006978 [Coemansia sp. RSA 2706]KAJ2296871.1 hypothetical protein IWW54_006880 [Coemansia sp. RSA 2705]KAJ2303597.1 hypothetical protein IWW52_006760 [Coemansia sp. RSA 2704]KAJ2312045.1 hypothetical protein IWW51_006328 [Coemansia sp. RSA 2702]KAJ2366294.1 hypothetical protein H4S01_002784 [Coemansia sp. RSA 2610]KAJ2386804.1 hypothetical protein H4S02_003674 [Coemansia sp. RSA 2611]KAJ270999
MEARRASKIRAVIFDIGGVVVKSPFLAISAYEREHGLPANYINVALSRRGDAGAFQQYERGEISHSDFVDQWTDELNDVAANNAAYRGYLQRRNLDTRMVLPGKTQINGSVLFARMMDVAQTPNPCVVELIRWLRRCGYRVAALTNNFQNDVTSGKMRDEIFQALFDEFVESSVVGLRKPDARFYLHACNLLEVGPEEVVFLDDIGKNLRAADRLGMTAVQVEIGREQQAVDAVKKLVRARGAFAPKI